MARRQRVNGSKTKNDIERDLKQHQWRHVRIEDNVCASAIIEEMLNNVEDREEIFSLSFIFSQEKLRFEERNRRIR